MLDLPQLPEFQTFLDEQTLLPAGWLTPSDEEEDLGRMMVMKLMMMMVLAVAMKLMMTMKGG